MMAKSTRKKNLKAIVHLNGRKRKQTEKTFGRCNSKSQKIHMNEFAKQQGRNGFSDTNTKESCEHKAKMKDISCFSKAENDVAAESKNGSMNSKYSNPKLIKQSRKVFLETRENAIKDNLVGRSNAKTRKGKAIYTKRDFGEFQEGMKSLLLVNGPKCNQLVRNVLSDIRDMRKPFSKLQKMRGTEKTLKTVSPAYETKPLTSNSKAVDIFDDPTRMEQLLHKNVCSLFLYGSSSKKRPHRLIFGRSFNNQILDFYEFHIENHTPIYEFSKKKNSFGEMRENVEYGDRKETGIKNFLPRLGTKPLLIIQGSGFIENDLFEFLRNIFADIFRGSSSLPSDSLLALSGIDRIISISIVNTCSSQLRYLNDTKHHLEVNERMQYSMEQQKHVENKRTQAINDEDVNEIDNISANCKGNDANDMCNNLTNSLTKEMEVLQKHSTSDFLVCIRQYKCFFKNIGEAIPFVHLEESGPQIDLKLDRYKKPSPEMWKAATKYREKIKTTKERTKTEKKKKNKSIGKNKIGDIVGRVFVDKPDWSTIRKSQNNLLKKHVKRQKNG